ncbi:MAG TPA: hypothetical protein VN767_00600 [Streptosporangiaceae bacterium]|nr:hypothetical protein [Streptosporangiaceae bacterium]
MEGVSVPVVGPSVIFPRGYLWFAPIWFAVAAGWLYLTKWPLWFRADAAAGLLIALLVLIAAINSLTFRAFSADRAGVRLGLHPGSKRRGRRRRSAKHLSWQQIERVRLARRPGGVRLDIVLGPEADMTLRGHPGNAAVSAINTILMLVIPFYYLVRPTGLTSPLDGPPRYRVRLRNTTVDELKHVLRQLAPPEVAIAVLVRRRRSVLSAQAAG